MVEKNPILVVTEESRIREYEDLPLKDEQISVIPPERAMGAMIGMKADLLLLDCGNEAGLELLLKIKPRFPELPIIFVTDQGSEELVMKVFRAGARDYHHRPVNHASFFESLARVLRAKRAGREKRNFISLIAPAPGGGAAMAEARKFPEFVQSSVSFIQQNITQNINLDDLADHAQMSKFHFSREFKDITGMSPMRFVKYMKIQKAKALLAEERKNISLVAMEMGFTDVGSFIRCFKTFEGITPSTYRATHRDR